MVNQLLFKNSKSLGSRKRFAIFFRRDRSRSRIAVILFTLFLVCPNVWSDTIKLKSGKIVHGTIRERNSRLIELDVGLDFPITYYSDEVQEVIVDDQKASSDTAPTPAPQKNSGANNGKADEIEQQGLALIDDGKMDDGVALLRQAVTMDPKASRHLTLGSILFGNGVTLSKGGNNQEALKIFHEAEKEIQEATAMFDPNAERTLLSQAYYLLGEMYANAFDDKSKAKEFYEKSLSFYANPKAQQGLDAIQ